MEAVIDIAKVTSKGQITIPKAIRDALGIHSGDRMLLSTESDGAVRMRNATLQAFDDVRAELEGVASQAGIESDDDVIDIIREMRYGTDRS